MRKYRKPKPSPPHWYWWDTDNCWFCKNKHGCGSCKILKELAAKEREHRKQKEKQELRKY